VESLYKEMLIYSIEFKNVYLAEPFSYSRIEFF